MKLKVLTSNSKLDLAIKKHKAYFTDRSYNRFVDQTIEEMAELTKVFIKERRGRLVQAEIRQEIADVIIALECILREKDISPAELDNNITAKLTKWLNNINKGKE